MTPAAESRTPGATLERRRVLYVPVLFHPEPWNGIMEHLYALMGRLDRRMYDPLLATRPDDGLQTAELATRTGVSTVDLGAARTVRTSRSVFASVRPDIVHVHTPSTSGLARLALAARLARVPRVVLTLHQVAPDDLSLFSRLVNRSGHHLIDATIAVSTGAADTQATRAGLRRKAIRVIPNGVDDAPTGTDREPFVRRSPGDVWVGYFGRLATEKGVDVLIEAVGRVRSKGTPLHLLVVGDGYERTALEDAARSGGGSVVFAGYRTDARDLMNEVDIVVHPPGFEGFGLVVAEAMAARKPVVATDVIGGIPDMVDHERTGLLVPFGDVAALAAALDRLCSEPRLRTELGTAGRERYEQELTADRMVDETVALYQGDRRFPTE